MTTLPHTTETPARPLPGGRVIDAPVRAFHGLFAVCFAGAWLSGDSEHWRLVHVTLGYTFGGLLIFRILWGLAGPRQAGLAMLWRKLKHRPGLSSLLDPARRRAALQWLLSATVAGMLLSTLPLTLSGLAVYQEWGGEWLEEVHEFFANGFLLLVGAHLALLVVLSGLRRQNLALPMLTGRRAEPGPDLVKRNYGLVALLMLGAVLAFWGWQAAQSPGGLSGSGENTTGLSAEPEEEED
jgi:cytochrome b